MRVMEALGKRKVNRYRKWRNVYAVGKKKERKKRIKGGKKDGKKERSTKGRKNKKEKRKEECKQIKSCQ